MIRLVEVTKRYEGAEAPAVAPLTMEIQRGEFICLVGPSGCGKTTTLRMINRLVEPSGGQIWIDGQDVTHVGADELRRHIGYVIQQVGLMPHMTIGQNVGLVPSMLGWDKKRIEARVDELLELVGLDPSIYRSRYPKQLSGGQQQRVGVARALAADPPVMLMDEPFGAIDPIARDRLQGEFLQLQQRIRKTIVFVTHDIDEALRLGDRIAIFGEGSRLAQIGTPLEILTNPADDFVRSFIGEGAGLRRLSLLRVGDLDVPEGFGAPQAELAVESTESVSAVLERMLMQGASQVKVSGGATMTVQDMLFAASQTRQGITR
jgi:osmoprotectant transport system ATP-binding protein